MTRFAVYPFIRLSVYPFIRLSNSTAPIQSNKWIEGAFIAVSLYDYFLSPILDQNIIFFRSFQKLDQPNSQNY